MVGLIEDATNHRLPLEQAIGIAKETCQGLEFAHSRGIVHRDFKPINVWLTLAPSSGCYRRRRGDRRGTPLLAASGSRATIDDGKDRLQNRAAPRNSQSVPGWVSVMK